MEVFWWKKNDEIGIETLRGKCLLLWKNLRVLASGNDSQILRFPNLFVEYDPMEI